MSSIQYLGRATDGSHRWRVRTHVGKAPGSGAYRQRSRVFHTPTDSVRSAERKAASIRADLERERDQIAAGRGTVKELTVDWLAVKAMQGRSPRTLVDYRTWCDTICDRFGTAQVTSLTASDVDAWYRHLMDEGMKPASVQHLHRVFRALLIFGQKKRDYPPHVTSKVTPPDHRPAKVQPITASAMRALLEQLPDLAFSNAVRLLVATGMRRGEVVGLKWQNIDTEKNEILIDCAVVTIDRVAIVKTTKSRRERKVSLNGLALAALADQRTKSTSDVWVFPDANGNPSHPEWLTTMWTRYRNAKDARAVRLHDLRHWFASTAINEGASLAAISSQLGHADTAITARVYAHGDEPGRRAASQAVALALGAATSETSAPTIPPD